MNRTYNVLNWIIWLLYLSMYLSLSLSLSLCHCHCHLHLHHLRFILCEELHVDWIQQTTGRPLKHTHTHTYTFPYVPNRRIFYWIISPEQTFDTVGLHFSFCFRPFLFYWIILTEKTVDMVGLHCTIYIYIYIFHYHHHPPPHHHHHHCQGQMQSQCWYDYFLLLL